MVAAREATRGARGRRHSDLEERRLPRAGVGPRRRRAGGHRGIRPVRNAPIATVPRTTLRVVEAGTRYRGVLDVATHRRRRPPRQVAQSGTSFGTPSIAVMAERVTPSAAPSEPLVSRRRRRWCGRRWLSTLTARSHSEPRCFDSGSLNVNADLERELAKLVLDYASCGRRSSGFPAWAVRPSAGPARQHRTVVPAHRRGDERSRHRVDHASGWEAPGARFW